MCAIQQTLALRVANKKVTAYVDAPYRGFIVRRHTGKKLATMILPTAIQFNLLP